MYYNIYVRSLLCTTTIYVRSLLCTFVRHFSRSPTIVDSTNCKRTFLCQAFWQMFYKCVFPRQATSISLFTNPRKDWFDALDSTAVGEVWMKCLIEFSIHGIIHLLYKYSFKADIGQILPFLLINHFCNFKFTKSRKNSRRSKCHPGQEKWIFTLILPIMAPIFTKNLKWVFISPER